MLVWFMQSFISNLDHCTTLKGEGDSLNMFGVQTPNVLEPSLFFFFFFCQILFFLSAALLSPDTSSPDVNIIIYEFHFNAAIVMFL